MGDGERSAGRCFSRQDPDCSALTCVATENPDHAVSIRFVVLLSICHMLTVLAIACRRTFLLDRYDNEVVGYGEEVGMDALTLLPRQRADRLATCFCCAA
jgi:hypothetical protein